MYNVLMNADLKKKFRRLKITLLPGFDPIMDKYDRIGINMSISAFYRDHVKPIEPSITERQWGVFMKKLRGESISHVAALVEKSKAEALAVHKMQGNALKNLAALGDITLKEILESPELLNAIPYKDRMAWFFKGMSAEDSRARTNLATIQDQREQSFFEKMMDGAQYGGIDPDHIQDAEFTEIKNENGQHQEQPIPHGLPAGNEGFAGGK